MVARTDGFPRALLRQPVQARLAYFTTYTIGHAHIQQALNAVLDRISRPRDTWTPVVQVIGPAGVGKTTLVRAVERELARRLRGTLQADPGRLPFASISSEVPESGSFNWKDFCFSGLEALREPLIERKIDLPPLALLAAATDLPAVLRPRTPTHILRRVLVSALLHRAPAALLVDEAQHLAMVTGARKFQHQMDYIKRLADATGVPIVLVGNYGLCLLRNQSAQLGRRTVDIHFRRYDVDREQDAADFRDILLSFQAHLPLPEPPDLLSRWDYLYVRSVGCIGLLKQWLLDALADAGMAAERTITTALLERTAPLTSTSTKVLEEALDGESLLADAENDADSHAAEEHLRRLLRLNSAPSASQTAPVSPTTARQSRGVRPGIRRPRRDPVGPAGEAASGT